MTIAWFTMNREVENSGVQLRSNELPFEVAVTEPYTNPLDYSTLLSTRLSYDTTAHETGGNVDSIKCLMVDETEDVNNPNRGLQPGSHGTLSFRIIPKVTGTYTLHFNVAAHGYHAAFLTDNEGALQPAQLATEVVEGETGYVFYALPEYAASQADRVEELEDATEAATLSPAEYEELVTAREDSVNCPKAEQFMKGHMLFFEERDRATGLYSGFIDPGSSFDRTYTFTASDVAGTLSAERQAELTVTIYWIWPNTFGQIVLDNGNASLSSRDPAMFSSSQTAPEGEQTPREVLVDFVCGNKQYFFESTNSIFADSNSIRTAIGSLPTTPDIIIPLSNGYNNADQIIGENVQILFAEIIVSAD
ncbi:MAG: hypothetical protein K5695_05850 [Oscillospiraceae bacterium]|nr:hypothetical protein [Oscillospiraceae bacterium]